MCAASHTTLMASSVREFCERHEFTEVLNLLRFSGPPTVMQDVCAVRVLERLLKKETANKTAITELKQVKMAVDPLNRAIQSRASAKRQETEIAELEKRIKEVQAENQEMRTLLGDRPGKEPRIGETQIEETQILDSQDAQEVTYDDTDPDKTQPGRQ